MPTTTGVANSFIDFTRASNATVTDSDGKVKWAPHNLWPKSEQFDGWTTTATVIANATAAPNTTTTADFLRDVASNQAHRVLQSVTTTGTPTTVAVFAKPNGRSWVYFRLDDASTNRFVWFNVSTGAVGTSQTGWTAQTPISAGNGWYLLSATIAAPVVGANNAIIGVSNADAVETYTGDGASGVYLWGAHLYRSDLGGMQANTSAYPMYNPTTPKNWFGHSESFVTSWVAQNAAVTSNTALAPNGLQTAATITAAAGTAQAQVYQTLGITTNPKSISVYMKAGTYGIVQYRFAGDATSYANFDLINGVTGSSAGTVTSQISSVGNGWYRCSIVHTAATATNFYINMVPSASSARAANLVATGTETVYLWGAQLSDSASLDPYVPSYGAAPTAAAYYGPRRDFDPVTLACKGLLVEEQRTNTVLHSNDFSQAAWSKSNGGLGTAPTVTSGQADPWGGTTAWRLLANAGGTGVGDYSIIRQAVTTSTSPRSVWIKSNTGSNQSIYVGAVAAASVVTATPTWTRVSLTPAATSTIFDIGTFPGGTTNSTQSIDVLIWGAQCELAGAASVTFATSYIPTGAATATRNADVASVSTQAFPYSASASTLVAAFSRLTASAGGGAVSLGGTSSGTANSIVLDAANTGYLRAFAEVAGSIPYIQSTLATYTANSVNKSAVAYAENNANGAANGTAGTTDTSAGVPVVDLMSIGAIRNSSSAAAVFLNGHIRQITYLPRRISNAELQTRTA